MVKAGCAEYFNGGFRLKSAYTNATPSQSGKYKTSKLETKETITSGDIKIIIKQLEKQVLINNLQQQQYMAELRSLDFAHNISRKKINSRIKTRGAKERLNPRSKFKTSISCKKAGQLLGKSSWTGHKTLLSMIKDNIIRRKISDKPIRECSYAEAIPCLLRNEATFYRKGTIWHRRVWVMLK